MRVPGLELGRQLRAQGHEVVGVRRSTAGLEAIEAAGLEAVRADVTDADALESVPDVDAVVFAAGSGGRGAEAARRVSVDGLRTAIDPPTAKTAVLAEAERVAARRRPSTVSRAPSHGVPASTARTGTDSTGTSTGRSRRGT